MIQAVARLWLIYQTLAFKVVSSCYESDPSCTMLSLEAPWGVAEPSLGAPECKGFGWAGICLSVCHIYIYMCVCACTCVYRLMCVCVHVCIHVITCTYITYRLSCVKYSVLIYIYTYTVHVSMCLYNCLSKLLGVVERSHMFNLLKHKHTLQSKSIAGICCKLSFQIGMQTCK
jgi:hypothetical protein